MDQVIAGEHAKAAGRTVVGAELEEMAAATKEQKVLQEVVVDVVGDLLGNDASPVTDCHAGALARALEHKLRGAKIGRLSNAGGSKGSGQGLGRVHQRHLGLGNKRCAGVRERERRSGVQNLHTELPGISFVRQADTVARFRRVCQLGPH